MPFLDVLIPFLTAIEKEVERWESKTHNRKDTDYSALFSVSSDP